MTKWTTECDARIYKLICYVKSTLHRRMVGFVGDRWEDLEPHLYADADFAGCLDTNRSTSGVHLCLEGPYTRFPIAGRSVRQTSVSNSTPEAEIVSGHFALKSVLYPTLDLFDATLPPGYVSHFHEDNQAMIQVCKSGRNPTMKHLGRVHRVDISWLHEALYGDNASNIRLYYTESAYMAGDIYTKASPSRRPHRP